MDETRFDSLIKSVNRIATRRAALRTAGAGSLAAAVGALGFDAAAKKKKKKKKKCKGKIKCGNGCCSKSNVCLARDCSLYGFVGNVGSEGSGEGQFLLPGNIGIDGDDNVYLIDSGTDRILKYDQDATFLTSFGSSGSGDGQFLIPGSIAVLPSGASYVADVPSVVEDRDRIQKFKANGEFDLKWGTTGTGNGEFNSLNAVAVAPSGKVYTAEYFGARVQRFDANGVYETQWNTGEDDEPFDVLGDIKVDSNGNVFTLESGDFFNRVQKFDADGGFIRAWTGGGGDSFDIPTAMAIDGDDNVYVIDAVNGRTYKFDNDGAFITRFGGCGLFDCASPGNYWFPQGIAVDSAGSVYISDWAETGVPAKVEKLAPVGSDLFSQAERGVPRDPAPTERSRRGGSAKRGNGANLTAFERDIARRLNR